MTRTTADGRARLAGDQWVIDGHKWFISNARRAAFAILIARTEENPDPSQAGKTGYLVDIPSEGWTRVREVETMHGGTGTRRSASRTCACRAPTCWVDEGRGTASASIASGRRASRTACAGSRRRRRRST